MPRISALPAVATLASDDEIAIVDVSESTTKKATVSMFMPTGSVVDFAGTTAPTGWLLCYGQALDASTSPQYQALYDVIGNTYGGSDNSDFIVPDLRGRVVAGKDNMGGTSANRLTDQTGGVDGDVLGDTGGSETHTLTTAQIPNLDLMVNARTGTSASGSNLGQMKQNPTAGSVSGWGFTTGGDSFRSDYLRSMWAQHTTGGGSHNNVQPTNILNKIIKY